LQRMKPNFNRVATWMEEKMSKINLLSLEV
jgi:hypothetical protein